MGIETIAIAAIAASVIGAGVGVYGQIQQGNAAKAQSNYQSQIAANAAATAQRNAALAQKNAQYAEDAGAFTEANNIRKTRAMLGAQQVSAAANGLNVNEGSSFDLQQSAATLGDLGNQEIRDDTARKALGIRIQAENYGTQASDASISGDMYRTAGDNAQSAAMIGAVGTGIGGVAKAGGAYTDMYRTGGAFSNVRTAA